MIKEIEKKYNIEVTDKLRELLSFVGKTPVRLGEGKYLLSCDWILSFKNETGVDNEYIIPIVDLSDNDYLVYDVLGGKFAYFNIVDGNFFGRKDAAQSVRDYIDILKKR